VSDNKIQKVSAEVADRLLSDEEDVEVGQWYWVQDCDEKKEDGTPKVWLGCVTHVGSNYAELNGIGWYQRVHFNEFDDVCKREHNADAHIEKRVAHYRDEVDKLMGRVKEITSRLGVAPSLGLPAAGSETRALATLGLGQDVSEHKAALVKAKDKTLPDLFEEIEKANKRMGKWMKAKLIPLKAQAAGMKGSISKIEDRIFSVELYAGLSEEVKRIADGKAAPIDTKLHLLQRRHYMDEECLVDYQTGGMDFKGIGAFDRWLKKPRNRDRLLPFPRCIVAFRVRRNTKERQITSLSDFISISGIEAADKKTFLYIRNGNQLYRMSTGLEFGEKLFPDTGHSRLDGSKIWADTKWSGRIGDVISDDEYQGLKEEYAKEVREYEDRKAAYDAALKSPEAQARAKEKGLEKPNDSCINVPWPGHGWFRDNPEDKFTHLSPENVYYDDIMEKIGKDIKQHNRIVLILQGLLDRSPTLHPHPPWQIWTNEGFEAALELVFDESRALPAGEKPDFKAYRAKLNESLQAGCITIGQELAWEYREAAKETRRMRNDWRSQDRDYPERFRPYGDPGPGKLARVVKCGVKSKKCTYVWMRERKSWRSGSDEPLRTTLTIESKGLLNVNAYVPGDFRQFFNDPRTRAEYLKWAPLLLEAEEYHAGNREIREPPDDPSPPKKKNSWEGKLKYQRRKRKKALLGKSVRLTRTITTRGGDTYEKGSLWKAFEGAEGKLDIIGITEEGEYERDRQINAIDPDDVELDSSIPDREP
jgi:hypothetical protein